MSVCESVFFTFTFPEQINEIDHNYSLEGFNDADDIEEVTGSRPVSAGDCHRNLVNSITLNHRSICTKTYTFISSSRATNWLGSEIKVTDTFSKSMVNNGEGIAVDFHLIPICEQCDRVTSWLWHLTFCLCKFSLYIVLMSTSLLPILKTRIIRSSVTAHFVPGLYEARETCSATFQPNSELVNRPWITRKMDNHAPGACQLEGKFCAAWSELILSCSIMSSEQYAE